MIRTAPKVPIKTISYSREKPVVQSRTINDFYVVSFDVQETPNRVFTKIIDQEKKKEKE
jgi:hypothetical protein